MNQREFGGELSELSRVIESIPYQEIFKKIEALESSLKEIESAYKDEIKKPQDSAYLGGKLFDINVETADFIRERLEDLFKYASKNPHHKLWIKINDLKTALNQFKFNEVRLNLEKLKIEAFPSEEGEFRE